MDNRPREAPVRAAPGPGAPLLTGLAPLAVLYGGAVRLRARLYDRGWLASYRLSVPVISVGNLTAGGAGKSPMVSLVARLLLARGRRPVIVSRGYGGTHRGRATVVSEGAGALVGARVAGDEPVMLATQTPGVPVVVARRRRDGGDLAVSRLGAGCVILDDGFQHRALARDLDMLLIDGEDPFGNGRMLPAGPLREPAAAMRRAGAIVITRCDRAGAPALALVAAAIGRHCPTAPVFHATGRPVALIETATGSVLPLEKLAGRRAVVFAGIASPERFFEDAAAAGAELVATRAYADHHRFTGDELRELAGLPGRHQADLLLTTEKDAARLAREPLSGLLPPLHALRLETVVREAEAFAALIDRAVA